MNKKNYIIGILINALVGIILGVITEFALILDIKWLIAITQNEIFWVALAILISIFSKNYLSTLINTSINLLCMTFSYYMVRQIIYGYTNIGGLEWYGLLSICVAFYFGTLVFLIKEKIRNKKIENAIPKLNIIFMTLGVPLGWGIWYYFIQDIHFQPIFCSGFCLIFGVIIGSILGRYINKKSTN